MADSPFIIGAETQIYTAVDSDALKIRRWRVRVMSGTDTGMSVELERGSLLIGSADSNDIILQDPCVSRAHLEMRMLDDSVQVRDLGSSNGTFHHGTRIQESTIQGATVIRVGNTEIALEPADQEVPIDTNIERLGEMVGTSAKMRELFGKVIQVGPTNAGVLIEGETGSGKELLAHEIHNHSIRQAKPIVVVDCGALPTGLVESELFGHLRGAFTGAIANRDGAFEFANGGTIFLDEIGELPMELQPKLLRVLEQRQIKKVGSNKVIPIDVRVVAATSRNLFEDVVAGTFRRDLYYRLAVVRLRVPPLRERLEDIPRLAQVISQAIANREIVIPEVTINQLKNHSWPGNIRELRNVLAHALTLRPNSSILELPETLGIEGQQSSLNMSINTEVGDYRKAKQDALAHFEVNYLQNLLNRHNWNVSSAAREAGVDRNYLHRLMKRHQIKRP